MNLDFVQREGDAVLLLIDLGIYRNSALLKTVYQFTDKCHIHLQSRSERQIEVRFTAKNSNGADLDLLSRDFANALLDQTLREVVADESESERSLILAHALSRHPNLTANNKTENGNKELWG